MESFVCAVMPGSSSVQVRTTPGISILKICTRTFEVRVFSKQYYNYKEIGNFFLLMLLDIVPGFFRNGPVNILLGLWHTQWSRVGGLLYTRDGSNLQYVTSASMVLLSYSRTLGSAHVDGVQCGSDHFTASQIRAFAKSQVVMHNSCSCSFFFGWMFLFFSSKKTTCFFPAGWSGPLWWAQWADTGLVPEGQSRVRVLGKNQSEPSNQTENKWSIEPVSMIQFFCQEEIWLIILYVWFG